MARRKPAQKVEKKNNFLLGPALVVGVFVLWAGAAFWATKNHLSHADNNSETPGLSQASAIDAFSDYIGL